MKREWKPGDVAMVTTAERTDARAVRRGEVWMLLDSEGYVIDPYVTDARPLVVIDPENREQVERLAAALQSCGPGRVPWGILTEDAQTCLVGDITAALREFANPTPPKPEEPTGLGAVVEDDRGLKWVCSSQGSADWYSDDLIVWREWSDISAVRVLSEGVQA